MAQPSLSCGPGKQFYNCNSNDINYFSGCCSVNACVPKGCPDQAASSSSTSASGTPAAPTQGPLTIIEGLPPAPSLSTQAKTSDTPAPPSTTPATPTSSTSSSSATPSAPASSPSSNQAQATPTTVFLVTSEVFVTPAVVTPTSNGVVLPPTSSEITSTALTSLSTVITPSSSFTSTPVSSNPASPTNVPSSTSSSNTPIIAGVVGGVVGAAVAALLIWLLLRWHRRSKRDQIRAAQHDDDPRLQGIDANRAGDNFEADKDPSFAYTMIPQTSRPVTASSHDAPFSSGSVEATDTQNGGYFPSRPNYSPFAPSSRVANGHPATPMITAATRVLSNDKDLETAGSKLDQLGPHLELSGEPAANVAELAPLPERSLINASKQPAKPSGSRITGKAGPSPTTEGSWMHPNLDLSADRSGSEKAREGDERHVMSWANYKDNEPGPAR